MAKRIPQSEGGLAPNLERTYEGEQVLAGLLKSAGASIAMPDVVEMLRQAQAAEMGADEVFPDLFDEEPRFASPAEARRLYSNLFGLWDRIASGGPIEPKPGKGGAKREPTPPPAPIEGPLTEEFVAAAWKHLADLSPRENERLLHRWENTQPELTEAIQLEAAGDDAVLENVDTLAFECWALLDLAQPRRRIRVVRLDEVQAALAKDDDPEPALTSYILDALEDAKLDETAPLSDEQAERAARIARAVVRALAAAL